MHLIQCNYIRNSVHSLLIGLYLCLIVLTEIFCSK